MSAATYPLLVPPEVVANKSNTEWSKKEAQIYFDWLTGCIPERTAALLDFFGISCEGMRAHELLLKLGEIVAQKLRGEDYSALSADGARELTNAGYALAADMGLLIAKLILEEAGERVEWQIVRRPKSDLSYNLPVLVGFGKMYLDPVGGSIGETYGILMDIGSFDSWAKILDFWLNKLKKVTESKSIR